MEVGIGIPEEDLSYRLDVFAPSVLDVVQSAGGWLFDRRTAGWLVTVLLPAEEVEVLPLRILGVNVLPLGSTPISWEQRPCPLELAMAADVLDRDARAMRDVFRALEPRRPEVIMWGGNWPDGLVRLNGEIRHELSGAARAFKYHALKAASGKEPAPIGGIESFRRGTIASWSLLDQGVEPTFASST